MIPVHSTNKNAFAQPYIVCGTCAGIIDTTKELFTHGNLSNLSRDGRRTVAEYTVPDLQRSGINGCHFCSIISQSLVPAHSDEDVLSSSTRIVNVKMGVSTVSTARHGSKTMPSLTARLIEGDGTVVGNEVSFPLRTDDLAHAIEPDDARWSISTGSDAMFELAKQWLHDCLSEHQVCEEVRLTAISSNKSSFPEYLVNVNEDSVRLCPSISLSTRPSYLTLSHRWGESKILTLTSQNLPSLISDIPFESLCKTFQDAITVTRRMGYSYIWIDSLCIIQDSKEHWEKESVIMGDIYRSSVFTIAALGAADGDDGCFRTRNPLCFQTFTFEAGPGRLGYLSTGRDRKSSQFTGYGPTVEPLHERAWVVQERMLSPRTLFYGTFNLYWECLEQTSSLTQPKDSSVERPKYALYKACNLTVSGAFDESYITFSTWWTTIVTTYNPCGLTYGTDKLVAIRGIIKLVESKTGMHNIAGLWKEYMLPDLLWEVDRPALRPTGGYQAPTWSWACLNSEVGVGIRDFSYNFDWKIEVLDAEAREISASGQISSAYIKIRGPLLHVRWELIEECYKLRWGERIPSEGSADDRIIFLPDAKPDPGQEIWALHIVHAAAEHTYMDIGIVLAKENEAGNTWIRVGSFKLYDWPSCPTTFFQDGLAEMATVTIL